MAKAKIASDWDGAKLAAWVKRMDLSADDAAEAVGVGRSSFFRYLNGEQAIPLTVELACRYLETQAKKKG